jgi:hypothetical protein
MGWIEEKLAAGKAAESEPNATAGEASFQQRAQLKWAALLNDLKSDADEFRRVTGNADFTQPDNTQCRISNPQAKIAVVIVADLAQHAVRYTYEPEDASTAVPEQGVLTLRDSGSAVDLYSADELLTSEQARKLMLEPLLFPGKEKSPAA